MSLSQKILKNTAVQVGGKIAGTVISLLAAGIVFRYLSPAGFGQYTTIVSFLQIFGILMDFGLYIILIKKIAHITDKSSPTVNAIFTLRILSGVIFLSIAPLAAWILGHYYASYSPEVVQGIALSSLFFLFISLNQLLSAVFQKALRADWIALGELIGKFALLAATIVVIWLDAGLLWVMSTLVISSAVNFAVNAIAARKYIHLRLLFDWSLYKHIITEAWPIALSIGLVLLYFKGDIIILTFFHTSNELIGIYGAPYKILEVLVTFPAMFTGLVLPVLTHAWQQNDRERFTRMLQKSFNALCFVAIPMIAGTLVISPLMIAIVAGPEFSASVPLLNILIIATAAIFLGTLFGYIVVAIDKQKTMLYGYAFVAVSSLVGYLYFIPRYSIFGAAWITVYSEVMVVLISIGITVYATRVRIALWPVIKSIVASFVMFWALVLIVPPALDLLNRIGVGNMDGVWLSVALLSMLIPFAAAVYGVCLLALKAITVAEIKELVTKKQL